MSNINLFDTKQAVSHPWCLYQQQGASHVQGGGRRQGEHSYAPIVSSTLALEIHTLLLLLIKVGVSYF